MDRLTRRKKATTTNGKEFVVCEHIESDCNDSCMYGRCKWNEKALNKLKDYEDAEEAGLLLRLPCKVGDTIYILRSDNDCWKIISHTIKTFGYVLQLIENEVVGEFVFLTLEEAEAALKAIQEGKK